MKFHFVRKLKFETLAANPKLMSDYHRHLRPGMKLIKHFITVWGDRWVKLIRRLKDGILHHHGYV